MQKCFQKIFNKKNIQKIFLKKFEISFVWKKTSFLTNLAVPQTGSWENSLWSTSGDSYDQGRIWLKKLG